MAIRKHIKRLAETNRFAREQGFCTVEKTSLCTSKNSACDALFLSGAFKIMICNQRSAGPAISTMYGLTRFHKERVMASDREGLWLYVCSRLPQRCFSC